MVYIALAQQTLAAVASGHYEAGGRRVEFGAAVQAAMRGTRGITPAQAAELAARRPRDLGAPAVLSVVDANAVQVAQQLAARGPVAVLNFASAVEVGGGFLRGAKAQEEGLCRCSALYPCLESVPAFYAANRACGSALYTDHAIWSPDVPFCRGADYGWLPEPFCASVLTSPAPFTARATEPPEAIEATFVRRVRQVLAIAAAEPPMSLVLGAWGCGAFGGDPQVVSEVFARALESGYRRAFVRIVFAVLVGSHQSKVNHAVFAERFASA